MNTKFFIYLLPVIMMVGGGCAHKKTVVQDRIVVQYAKGAQDTISKRVSAKDKIPLKSLSVLVMDDTDILADAPFKEPLHILADDSISVDSLIVSRYYNQMVLESFQQSLPPKSNIYILKEKLSQAALDSLIYAEKFDLVITAQNIELDYAFRYVGRERLLKLAKQSAPGTQFGNSFRGSYGGSPGISRRYAGDGNFLTVGRAFDFSSQIDFVTLLRAIGYRTCWNLQWTDIALNEKDTMPLQIEQEGFLTDADNQDASIIFSAATRQIGEELAKLFKL